MTYITIDELEKDTTCLADRFIDRGVNREEALITAALIVAAGEIKELNKTLKNNGEQYHG